MTESLEDPFVKGMMEKLRQKGKLSADLFQAAQDLIEMIEGISGTMEYGGDWRSKNGFRVKDLDAWVRLYNSVKDLEKLKDTPLQVGRND